MSVLQEAMRRVITGDDPEGRSVIIIDGGPSSQIGTPDFGGLFEIWEDAASGPLDPRLHDDLGPKRPVLGARQGNFQVRWFIIHPSPEGVPKAQLDQTARDRFAEFDGLHHVIDQTRHPGMHETHSTDIIVLLQGDASLILEGGETRLKPGQVVIQRGTNHAWVAHGGPAFFLAVLMDRELQRH
jgi:quercetin dioxygenase-like cupin family protein